MNIVLKSITVELDSSVHAEEIAYVWRQAERNRKRNYSAQRAVATACQLINRLGTFLMNVAMKETCMD